MAPFTASPNEEIKTSAEGAALVFSRLADLHQKSIAEHKALIDAVAEGKLKPGSVLERQVELAALYDETWKFLIPVVAEGYAAVVEVEPTIGFTSRLSLANAGSEGRDPSKTWHRSRRAGARRIRRERPR